MALGSTVYKVDIDLSNFNTHYYENFNLTIAKHPSENESRMMFRLLAFLHSAHNDLKFCKGLSSDGPELCQKDYSGDIIQWIGLGTPEPKRVRQACGKSQSVKIYTYDPVNAHEWYQKNKAIFARSHKLEVFHLNVVENGPVDKIVARTMRLSCIIEEQHIYLSNDHERISITVDKA